MHVHISIALRIKKNVDKEIKVTMVLEELPSIDILETELKKLLKDVSRIEAVPLTFKPCFNVDVTSVEELYRPGKGRDGIDTNTVQGTFSVEMKEYELAKLPCKNLDGLENELVKNEEIKYKEYMLDNNLAEFCLVTNDRAFNKIDPKHWNLIYIINEQNFTISQFVSNTYFNFVSDKKIMRILGVQAFLDTVGRENFVKNFGNALLLSGEFKPQATAFIKEYFVETDPFMSKLLKVYTKEEPTKDVFFSFKTSIKQDKPEEPTGCFSCIIS